MARRAKTDKPAQVRSEHKWSRWRVGLLALIVIAIPVYLAFTKDIPFTSGYRLHAVFESSNNLRAGSPVRIAGVNVGRVKAVGPYKDTDMAEVTLEIDEAGLPIHQDATLKIRPRIFLEGNFFVDLQPGTPGSPDVDSGGTIGVTQTSTPVQLDELLTALQSDTREDLQILLQEYGTSLNTKPTPEEDAELPPEVRGLTGAEAINRSYDNAGDAFKGSALVTSALLGSRPHDLSRTIAGVAQLARTLSRRERQLQDLITNLNITAGAFANQSGALSETVRLLGPTLAVARDALLSVDQALPPLRAFATEILPGVRETPATVAASFPWLAQVQPLLSQDELGGLLTALKPTTVSLGALTAGSIRLLPQLDDFGRCFAEVVLPAGNIPLDDGALTTRRADGSTVEAYKEFWYGLVGMASSGQSFDGNGNYLRTAASGGEWQVKAGTSKYSSEGKTLIGNTTDRPLGTRPLYPRSDLPVETGRPCHSNPVPKLNGPQAGPGVAPPSVQVPTPPPYVRRVPTVPGTTTTGTTTTGTTPAATSASADDAPAADSLGAQLLSRLNPLNAGEGR